VCSFDLFIVTKSTTTMDVNEQDMLMVGLQTIGFDITKVNNVNEAKNVDRFRASYGASPLVCSIIFNEVRTRNIGDATIHNPRIKHFLMALHWLKRYPVEKVMTVIFKLHEDTVRRKVFEFVEAIQALKVYKVKLSITFFFYFFFVAYNMIYLLFVEDCVARCC
jgi:hypothetical protein